MIGRAEMIALARQYAKRRGLKWTIVEGDGVRLLTPAYEAFCPVTAACAQVTGEYFPESEYRRAGALIQANLFDVEDLANDADIDGFWGGGDLMRELNESEAEQ